MARWGWWPEEAFYGTEAWVHLDLRLSICIWLPLPMQKFTLRAGGSGTRQEGAQDLKGSGKDGPCRHCSRSHHFPSCTTGKGPSLRPAAGTRPAPLGPVERAPPPHTPHRLVSLRELGTPGTRSHDPGSIFHTLSRCSYWTVPRPPPRLLRPQAQSGATGLARWAGGAVARGARPPSRRAW